jgi:hypothetical protein
MKLSSHFEEQKYILAKRKVEELKGYYTHLAIYVVLNLFLSGAQIIDGITENKSFTEIFSDFGIYGVWVVWGVGLVFHSLKIFVIPFFMGTNWEARKINEYMNNKG